MADSSSMNQPPGNETTQDRAQERGDAWVDDHGDILYRYAVARVGRREIAEDLVQETFVAALHAAGQFRGESSERTWLIGILRHKLLDWRRHQGRHPLLSLTSEEDEVIDEWFDERGWWRTPPKDWTVDSDSLAEKEEFWTVFHRCLDGVPDRIGKVFAMRVIDETPSEDICKALNLSSTNFWVMLHRARARLRKCLESNWFVREEKV
jgi:RNA polymerase sigma-70 factor (ECF subfamily)